MKKGYVVLILIFITLFLSIHFYNKKINSDKVEDPDIIFDKETSYLWQNQMEKDKQIFVHTNGIKYPKYLNWGDANSYCKTLRIDGISGWSLPSEHELYRSYQLGSKFKNSNRWLFWSSTQTINNDKIAGCVNFDGGMILNCSKNQKLQVQCVHKTWKSTQKHDFLSIP